MKCPRCGIDLKSVRGIGLCARCGGAFLAGAAQDSVARALDDGAAAIVEVAETQASGRASTAPPARCPQCSVDMTRFHVGPVDVDTCMAHGTWYDRGELAIVRDSLRKKADVPSSGLELAHEPVRSAPSVPGFGGGFAVQPIPVDHAVQAKINDLTEWEHEQHRRERWNEYDNQWESRGPVANLNYDLEQGNTVSAVLDVLDLLF